ncbi:MAG: fumarylacetoacetate hydrolase family protein [Christensenellaceae bacterium]|jgi:2-keto-4-pentenoate hydratase/2-oxohepta-3-ene-1,7-dioic acid hydratase in catechol pathway|nr:fumarylacetoacetate hydrolase family protein [Christensenellaceae bacterium]
MQLQYIKCEYQNRVFWAQEQGEQALVLSGAPFCGGQATGEAVPLPKVRLLAPIDGGKIIAVGKNYRDHIDEMKDLFGDGDPSLPALFWKPSNCINDPEAPVVYPSFTKRVDYEGELAAVIGKRMTRVPAAQALSHVLGYTIANDVTARDIQKSELQWTRGKSVDGFGPLGPRIVCGLDPAALSLRTRVNGAVRQQAHTSQFVTPLPALLAFITEAITLEPGDMVLTGTPAGVSPLQPGDVVEVEISGIGILRNTILAADR